MSSNWPLFFLVLLVVGAAVFGIGTALVRSAEPRTITWTRLVTGDDAPVEVAERRDMIERLELVDADWAREALALAAKEEPAAR